MVFLKRSRRGVRNSLRTKTKRLRTETQSFKSLFLFRPPPPEKSLKVLIASTFSRGLRGCLNARANGPRQLGGPGVEDNREVLGRRDIAGPACRPQNYPTYYI